MKKEERQESGQELGRCTCLGVRGVMSVWPQHAITGNVIAGQAWSVNTRLRDASNGSVGGWSGDLCPSVCGLTLDDTRQHRNRVIDTGLPRTSAAAITFWKKKYKIIRKQMRSKRERKRDERTSQSRPTHHQNG